MNKIIGFQSILSLGLSSLVTFEANAQKAKTNVQSTPNIIIILIDDMGYGDLGCYGSKLNKTPNLDKMAREGIRFTDFYVASSVSTPSRAALMTGCYPPRVDMAINENEKGGKQVLFPVSIKGLNPTEITIAEVLKEKGYRTACIGKWHLGDQAEFLPTRQGFDYYFGIPYSNDMGGNKNSKNPPLPLMRNEIVIEAPADQNTLTKRYTEEVIKFIKEDSKKPFFIYLPHSMVHVPLHASDAFRGKSQNGIYGDAVEEIDWSTGTIIDFLKAAGLDDNTLIMFTSDNGGVPSVGGSNLPLSGGKATCMEGGFREPFIVRWPGKIPGGRICTQMATSMDLLPTIVTLCRANLPADRIIDGKDISTLLINEKVVSTPRIFYYFFRDQLQAVRWGDWKLFIPLKNKLLFIGRDSTGASEGKLYNLKQDIGEQKNVITENPDIVRRLMAIADSARLDLGDYNTPGKNIRKAGFVKQAVPMVMK